MQSEIVLSSKKKTKEKNSVENKTKAIKRLGEFVNYTALPVIILAIWWLLTSKELFPSAILPSISTVAKSFIDQLKSGQLIDDISISLLRVVKGFLIASILGITFGVLMGISETINRFFTLSLKGIRQIPMMAWIPLIILWVGIGEASKITIIILGAFFPVLVNTMSGIQQIPKGYVEVGRMFKLNKWELFRKVYLPSAIPSIFVGLKLALGFSWMIVVAAELIASSSGIGYRINDARSLMQPEIVMVGMFVIGFIGILMDQILGVISKHITPWSQTK